MNVKFDTAMYERHSESGRAPRGQGNWAFCEDRHVNRPDYLQFVFWHNGSYSEAKLAARKHFSALYDDQRGTLYVVVLP